MPEIFDIQEAVLGLLEWTEEDQGIGHYEFWGSKERDVNWQPVLENPEVEFEVDLSGVNLLENEDWLPLYFNRYTQAFIDENRGYDVTINARLSGIKYFGAKKWSVKYEIELE